MFKIEDCVNVKPLNKCGTILATTNNNEFLVELNTGGIIKCLQSELEIQNSDYSTGDYVEITSGEDCGCHGTIKEILSTGYMVDIFQADIGYMKAFCTNENIKKSDHPFSPFEKVLVRNEDGDPWNIELFQSMENGKYVGMLTAYNQCVSYKNNKNLL